MEESMEKLSNINEQLDELLMKHLQLTQDYISITVECESHQKAGFINLAKARYIQGFHSVSKNCLYSGEGETEENRTPILTVTRELGVLNLDDAIPQVTYEEPTLNVNSDSSLDTQLNKQFGMLSSGTLKSAKGDFRKCIEKSIERVKIIEQLGAVRDRYNDLRKEKSSIMKCAEVAAP